MDSEPDSSERSLNSEDAIQFDGGFVEQGSDPERRGTLIEVWVGNTADHPLIHHSVEFDGYEHTTACGLKIPPENIRSVETDVPADLDSVENVCLGCKQDTDNYRGEGGDRP